MNLKPRTEKKSLTLAISFLLMISFFQIVYVPKASAQATTLSVDPPLIIDPALTPGSTFHINITVADVDKMWGYDVILSYDTTVLTATSYSSYDPFIIPWPSIINDTAGYVAVSYSMMFGEPEGFSTVEPAPILRIDFTVDALGISVLALYRTEISDIYGELILPVYTVDGYFSNTPAVEVGWIEGTVTHADTGRPIKEITVSADGYSDLTDSSGFYSLEVSPGAYDVTAEKLHYKSQTVTDVAVAAGQTVIVDFAYIFTPNATLSAPVIIDEALTPDSTFHINITVANITAMWGYGVVLFYDTTVLTATSYSSYDPFMHPWPSLINDTAGYAAVAYSMQLGEPVGYSTVETVPIARIDFTVDAFGTSRLTFFTMPSREEIADIYGHPIPYREFDGYFSNVPVVEVGWIEGTVTDADTGLPIEGATVSANGISDATDPSGFYSLEIPPGTYNVIAEMVGYFSQTVAKVSVAAFQAVTLDFALSPEVGWIEGTVTDADTRLPLEGATVSANGISDATDPSGFYNIEVPAPGTYDVTAEMTGYVSLTELDVSVSVDQTVIVDFALIPVSMPTAVLSVDPTTIVDETLTPDSTFHINITVANITAMWGYDIMVSYDTTVLTATSYSSYDPFIIPWPSLINDTGGYVTVAYSMQLGEPEGFSTVEPAPILRIDFTVDAEGYCLLDLNDRAEDLVDILGQPIDHDTVDGYFSNIEVTPYVLTIEVVSSGTTDPAPGDHLYPEGTVVSVDAIPDEGYMLDHWELDGVPDGAADPYSVTMDTDHTLTAIFKEIAHIHDIAITSVSAYPTTVKAGEVVKISVAIKNEGTETETFTVTIHYDDVTISVFTIFGLNPGETTALKFGWSTLTVTPGTYTLKAVASTVPGETDIEDNTFIDGTVTIIPPPIPRITIDPESGPVGTKVTVNGSDFPVQAGLYLMFDDHLVGFFIPTDQNGNFTVTFNVPLSEAGEHTVKVWTMYYPLDFYSAEAPFTVIDTTPLNVDADVGAIYFKGETAEFYVQTSFKGVPVDVTSIEVILYKPDGTAETLTAQRIATGLYKIEYRIKGKDYMLGAYTLVVEASYSSTSVNATGTSLKTFIVKSPWRELEREAPKVVLSVATIAAAIALVMVWRRED